MQLSAGGGFIHDQYVQPSEHQEASMRGCTVTRPPKVKPWKKRRAREADMAVLHSYAATDKPQLGSLVCAC